MHFIQGNRQRKHEKSVKNDFILSKRQKIVRVYVQFAAFLQFVKKVTNMLHYCKKAETDI